MSESSLRHHVKSTHGRSLAQNLEVDTGGGARDNYRVSSPQVMTLVEFIVEGGPAKTHAPGRLWENFIYWHWKSQVEIVQEGPLSLPQCPSCGMYMNVKRMIRHQRIDMCNRVAYMCLRRRDVEIAQREGYWGRIHQEPGGQKADREYGAGIVAVT